MITHYRATISDSYIDAPNVEIDAKYFHDAVCEALGTVADSLTHSGCEDETVSPACRTYTYTYTAEDGAYAEFVATWSSAADTTITVQPRDTDHNR